MVVRSGRFCRIAGPVPAATLSRMIASDELKKKRLAAARTVGLVFAGWTIYAALLAHMISIQRQMRDAPPVPYLRFLRWTLPEMWLWAALTFVILAAARRFPITAANWKRRLPLHLLFAVAIHATEVAIMVVIGPYVRTGGPRFELPVAFIDGLFFDTFIYAAIVSTWHAVAAHGQALRLRNELLEAE